MSGCECGESHAKKRGPVSRLLLKIKEFFLRQRYSKNSRKKADAWIDKEVKLAIAREKEGAIKEGIKHKDDVFTLYAVSCIEAAGRIAKQFARQNHSGMSAGITLGIIKKLCSHEPLSPLLGTDDEWKLNEWRDDYLGEQFQNKRDSRLFKNVSADNIISYSQNDIVIIVNDDDVWLKYPPENDAGTLDDNDPDVIRYFDARRAVQDKHNAEITFPYVFTQHYYKWNFETKSLDKLEILGP